MERRFWLWGFAFGLTAIILGAFGAHGLKAILSESQLDSFETGIRYQIYHAFIMIIIGGFPKLQSKLILVLIVSGVFLFSGSIYLLNLRDFLNFQELKYLGPVTPIGGLLLITAWGKLFYQTIIKK